MEGQLLVLANLQGSCEHIKNTPLPRPYDFFTRLFIGLFSALLPFGLMGFFGSAETEARQWMIIPIASLLSAVFIIMEKTGAANKEPFENRSTDVPLTALCKAIERDLLQLLSEPSQPDKLQPVDGYLY